MLLPKTLGLYITSFCTRACKHCFLWQNQMLNKHSLTLEHIEPLLDEARINGVFMVSISGGDPLLHPQLVDIVRAISRRNMLPLLGATGEGISYVKAKALKDAGLPCIQVSLDGASKASNDALRGAGNFDSVLASIKNIQAAGLKATLAICLHDKNCNELSQLLDLADELKMHKVKVALYKNDAKEKFGYNELTAFQKEDVLNLRRQGKYAQDKSWVSIPQVEIWPRAESKARKTPLIVNANGDIQAGEWGEKLGNLKEGDGLLEVYETYHTNKLACFLEKTVLPKSKEFGVSNIHFVPDEQLYSAAMVLRLAEKYEIYVRESLSLALRIFTILHELGHIAESTIFKLGIEGEDEEFEKSANLWAINFLKPYLKLGTFEQLASLCDDEDKLFEFVKNNLSHLLKD